MNRQPAQGIRVAAVAAITAMAIVSSMGTATANPTLFPPVELVGAQANPEPTVIRNGSEDVAAITESVPYGTFFSGGPTGLRVRPATDAGRLHHWLLILVLTTRGGEVRTASLSCNPDLGSIQDPKLACDELAAAGGSFDKLPTDRQLFCADYYAPVTATAVGLWDGCLVNWSSDEYPNTCQLQRRTGSVFKF